MPNRNPDTEKPEQKPKPKPNLNIDPPIDYHDEPPPVIKAQNEDVEEGENEGEGNRTADRNYRAGVEKTVKSGKVEAGAKKAEEALEDDEQREELEEAERDARKSQVH